MPLPCACRRASDRAPGVSPPPCAVSRCSSAGYLWRSSSSLPKSTRTKKYCRRIYNAILGLYLFCICINKMPTESDERIHAEGLVSTSGGVILIG